MKEECVASEQIKTFAFFDLESTGLPQFEFFQTKITELSITAISVAEFLTTAEDNLPRVQHKLTVCFNPYKRISLKATELTGLTNELLEIERKFDTNTVNLLKSFFTQLQPPVCLIAHNGNRFDFPLLKGHLGRIGGFFPFDLKCCDSLSVFKVIEELEERKVELLKSYSLKLWNDVKDVGTIISEDDEKLLDKETIEEKKFDEQRTQESATSLGKVLRLSEFCKRTLMTKPKFIQAVNETTPHKPIRQPINQQPHQTPIEVSSSRSDARRELFPPSTSSPAASQRKRKSFTLNEIYKRFYNCYPLNAHNAETDVTSLLKSALACKNDFNKIVNESCVDFCDVKGF